MCPCALYEPGSLLRLRCKAMTDHEDAEPASVGAKNAKGERGRFRSRLYLIFHVAPRIAPDVTVFNTLPGPGR